ncbi:MAG: YbfB/YjiJ family MFS transporter [Chloroflexota bacterium]
MRYWRSDTNRTIQLITEGQQFTDMDQNDVTTNPSTDSPSTDSQHRLITQALILSLGAAVALGFARFNYALLLPAMQTSLDWNYAQAGGMNTANAFGYMLGALLAAPVAARMGIARCFWLSLFLTGVSLVGSGLTDNFIALLIMRLLAGFCGAGIFISGATLASHLASTSRGTHGSGGQGGLVLGLYFGGVGIGIFLAGLGLPQLLEQDIEIWREAWIGMGILSILAVIPVRLRVGEIPMTASQNATSERWRFPTQLLPSIIAYFLFGLGYISYMTFVIAFLRSSGTEALALSWFWLLLGGSTFASAFIWRRLLDRAKGGHALAVVLVVVAIGAAIPLISTSLTGVLVSALLFGGAFLTVVSSVTNIVRRSLPAHEWGIGIAIFTVLFSIGQTIGPLISGTLADRTNTLAGGFAFSATVLFIGAILALFQHTDYN